METRSMARNKMRLERDRMPVDEDRLTNLPGSLIDEIVSRLPSRSIAWMEIASKKCANLLYSCPGIFFDEEEFENKSDRQKNYRLDQFISKYSGTKTPLPIQKIKIGTSRFRHSKVVRELYPLIDLNISNKIRELVLKFRHVPINRQPYSQFYYIRGTVFSDGVHLTILELEGCQFGDLSTVNVPFLKTVSLRGVYISSDSLAILVSASSSLESLVLQHCHELRTFQIVNPSLKKLEVNYCQEMETLYVDCPHLEYLQYTEDYQFRKNIKVSGFSISCSALREVDFEWLNFEAEVYDNIFSTSLLVRSLTLRSCEVQGTLKVLPRDLKHLELFDSSFPQLLCLSTVDSFSCGQSAQTFLEYHCKYMAFYSPSIHFTQIKSLKLEGGLPLSEKSFEFVLSFCPHLHDLFLKYCWNLKTIRITSRTLKILSITSNSDVPELECEIEAPNLVSFMFEGVGVRFSPIVVSRELVCKLKFYDVNHVYSALTIGEWGYYVRTFNMARRIELSNELTECILVPNQAAIKVNASLSNIRYRVLLSEVLCLPICPTYASLNLRICGHPFSCEPSALIDLKFNHIQQEDVHDCIEDHLYEASVEIKKDPSQALQLSRLFLHKARHLQKLTVIVSANICPTISPRINRLKNVSENCEIIFI